MLTLRALIDLIDNAYHVQIGPDSIPDAIPPAETQALIRFGEPIIECGGDFDAGGGVTFTLPANQKRFSSQFPVKEIFSRDSDANANAKAVYWRDTMATRIRAGVAAKVALVPGTVGTTVTTA